MFFCNCVPVGADFPEASIEVSMLTTDVGVKEEPLFQANVKQLKAGVPVQESKKLAGKSVSDVHPSHAR